MKMNFLRRLAGLMALAAMFIGPVGSAYAVEPNHKYITINTKTLSDGKSLDETIINGPPTPPPGYALERAAVALPGPNLVGDANSLTVPAFNWVFGCSSVSGAMIAGYYDRNGFPDMYTGPTDSGVMPLDNSVWGTWIDGNGDTYPNIPLAASHDGVDGRIGKGSIDDYWVLYGSSADDPYITGAWTQHTWSDAIGDYMKTSQSANGNTDGSTTFYNYTSSATPLTCADMLTYGIDTVDGTYGRKLFYEARGYTVTDCYSQKTDNTVAGGFSFAQFKEEIEGGRPVMLNLAGHTIVGVGYEDPATVYVHDTWDYLNHTMTWGTSYAGMDLLSVSIVNLQPPPAKIGAYRQGNWYLDSNDSGLWDSGSDFYGNFGTAAMTPLVGDWNGEGPTKIAAYVEGTWYFDLNGNGLWDGEPTDRMVTSFGDATDIPVAGDWNDDGKAEIGIYRPSNFTWYLDYDGNFAFDPAVDVAQAFGFGGCIPVVGDWDGNGRDQIGVYFEGQWYLDASGNFAWDGSPADTYVAGFGVADMLPVVGDWSGSGVDRVGAYRDGNWYLDLDGNGSWDPASDSQKGPFGVAGMLPLVGKW